MKQILCISLVILLLLPGLCKSYIFMHYQLNRIEIERTLCINKAKPKLKCHGACHLKKEMEAQEKKEKPASVPAQGKSESLYSRTASALLPAPQIHSRLISVKSVFETHSPFSNEIFHPPCC